MSANLQDDSELSQIHDTSNQDTSTTDSDANSSLFLAENPTSYANYTSPKEYKRMVTQLREELTLLREENTSLRAQHVEISAVSVKLQQQFATTQSQIDNLKNSIRIHLGSPISEKEYFRLEELPEVERSVVDTIKVGVYQQIGALKAARDSAVKRGSELAAELEKTTSENKKLQITLEDKDIIFNNQMASLKNQLQEAEQKTSLVAELTGKVNDLQHKLNTSNTDQERYLETKMELRGKTKELQHTELQLREAMSDSSSFKAELECAEEKLKVLMSEYYDCRLKYSEEQLTLQNKLMIAEEKLKLLNDVEVEAEVFIANVAAQDTDGSAATQLATIPASRRMQHAVTMTKRCLNLENQVAASKIDLQQKDNRIDRLEKSLSMAQDVLHGSSPYKLVEDTVTTLQRENDELKQQLEICRVENGLLSDKNKAHVADIGTLSRHRAEMTRIRDLLVQLGASPTLLQVGASPLALGDGRQGKQGVSSTQHHASTAQDIHISEVSQMTQIPSTHHQSQSTGAQLETSSAFVPGFIEIA